MIWQLSYASRAAAARAASTRVADRGRYSLAARATSVERRLRRAQFAEQRGRRLGPCAHAGQVVRRVPAHRRVVAVLVGPHPIMVIRRTA